MLGEDFVSLKVAVGEQGATRDDALSLTEKVGQHAGVVHGKRRVAVVGDAEAHGEARALALQGLVFHHAADADAGLFQRCGMRGDLFQRVVVVQVVLHGVEQEGDGGGEGSEDEADEGEAFFSSGSHRVVSGCRGCVAGGGGGAR